MATPAHKRNRKHKDNAHKFEVYELSNMLARLTAPHIDDSALYTPDLAGYMGRRVCTLCEEIAATVKCANKHVISSNYKTVEELESKYNLRTSIRSGIPVMVCTVSSILDNCARVNYKKAKTFAYWTRILDNISSKFDAWVKSDTKRFEEAKTKIKERISKEASQKSNPGNTTDKSKEVKNESGKVPSATKGTNDTTNVAKPGENFQEVVYNNEEDTPPWIEVPDHLKAQDNKDESSNEHEEVSNSEINNETTDESESKPDNVSDGVITNNLSFLMESS